MPIVARSKGSDSKTPFIQVGTHAAIVYGVVDLGTQPVPHGSPYPPRQKIVILWELPDCIGEFNDPPNAPEGAVTKKVKKPRAISRKFTNSLAKNSKLRPFLVAWRGREFTKEEMEGFDLSKLIGVNCLLSVAWIDGKGENACNKYATVTGAGPLMAGMAPRKAFNPPLYFSLSDCKEGEVVFPRNMPEWVQKDVMNSEEFIRMQQAHGLSPGRTEPTEDQKANLDPKAADEDVPF